MLSQGIDAISKIPKDRFNIDEYYDPSPDAAGKMYLRSGGFLDGIDQFDPAFFSISPKEAVALDPQQRMLLEVSWEALENAGIASSTLFGSKTGVFLGICSFDYGKLIDESSRNSRWRLTS